MGYMQLNKALARATTAKRKDSIIKIIDRKLSRGEL